MNALRRAVGRKEVMLGIVLLLAGCGWFGWHALVHPAGAQVAPSADPAASVKALLDAGQYREAAAEADVQLAAQPGEPNLVAYKAVAQLLGRQRPLALQTAEVGLTSGAPGPQAAALLAVKGLVLIDYEHQQPLEALPLTESAVQQAGSDPEAGLLARVAHAAALRSSLDGQADAAVVAQQTTLIRKLVAPVFASSPTLPASVWKATIWRQGLARLADAGVLAAEAGDAAAEAQTLALLQQSCPEDAWNCYFNIPDKALTRAKAGTLDDHARIAMWTATAFLYLTDGDRVHADRLIRKAIAKHVFLLNEYDDWSGTPLMLPTPSGRIKTVGSQEYHEYRNTTNRMALYSADWWATRVVRGEVDFSTAMAACDYHWFRTLLRLRAERETNPIRILTEENIRTKDYDSFANWLIQSPCDLQVEWEASRAAVIQEIGKQEMAASDIYRQVVSLSAEHRLEEALAVVAAGLETEPTLAETGICLRCLMARLLIDLGRPEEALPVLEAAEQVMVQGDPYLGHDANVLRPRILKYRTAALYAKGDVAAAIQQAEQITADASTEPALRGLALVRLTRYYTRQRDHEAAAGARDRLAAMADLDAAQRDALLSVANAFLARLKNATPSH